MEIVTLLSSDLEKGPHPHRQQSHHQVPKMSLDIKEGTYYDEIQLKLQERPWLESLHQFMDYNANGFAMNLAKRMRHFDIKVIHLAESGIGSTIKCSTVEEFEKAVVEDEVKERIGTLIIAKGLSRDMIEVLGNRFELEPEFFSNHLAGTELYRMGIADSEVLRAPASAPSLLSAYIKKAPFYAVEYRRAYQIEGGLESIVNLRITETSTPRGVQPVNHNLPDFFASEKISVYKKAGSNIGIILTDQLLSNGPPGPYILKPVTLLDLDNKTKNLGIDARQHEVSPRRELISWLQRLKPIEAKALFDDREQLVMRHLLERVESCGVMSLSYARHIMNRSFVSLWDAQFPNINFFLQISRSLQRIFSEQKRLQQNVLFTASLRCGGDEIAEQKHAFAFIDSNIDSMLRTLEEDVRFLVAEASIREGRVVGWVSKVAALFLPVSLLAQILSISDSGYTRWAMLGGLSVLFILISTYFLFFWNPVRERRDIGTSFS